MMSLWRSGADPGTFQTMKAALAVSWLVLACATPASALPEQWTGRWGTSAAECRADATANDNVAIERRWVHRYEWDCRIGREQAAGLSIRTEVACSYGDQKEAGGIELTPQAGGALRITFTGGARFGRTPPPREVKIYRRCAKR